MNKSEFLDLFHEEMDFYGEFEREYIHEDMELQHFSNWDSLSRATVFNFVEHEMGITLDHASLRQCRTIKDIMRMIGEEHFNQ